MILNVVCQLYDYVIKTFVPSHDYYNELIELMVLYQVKIDFFLLYEKMHFLNPFV
ncbi:unnamed protein product [Schistosoma curassoni]|uniref:Uncharacterized protein n=1 Tax=Schistosoma curassoni TaxID=6186 RepID=A0A183KE82_9TREM|nr:unnamed protein product [Schistosoma curassoni]